MQFGLLSDVFVVRNERMRLEKRTKQAVLTQKTAEKRWDSCVLCGEKVWV